MPGGAGHHEGGRLLRALRLSGSSKLVLVDLSCLTRKSIRPFRVLGGLRGRAWPTDRSPAPPTAQQQAQHRRARSRGGGRRGSGPSRATDGSGDRSGWAVPRSSASTRTSTSTAPSAPGQPVADGSVSEAYPARKTGAAAAPEGRQSRARPAPSSGCAPSRTAPRSGAPAVSASDDRGGRPNLVIRHTVRHCSFAGQAEGAATSCFGIGHAAGDDDRRHIARLRAAQPDDAARLGPERDRIGLLRLISYPFAPVGQLLRSARCRDPVYERAKRCGQGRPSACIGKAADIGIGEEAGLHARLKPGDVVLDTQAHLDGLGVAPG